MCQVSVSVDGRAGTAMSTNGQLCMYVCSCGLLAGKNEWEREREASKSRLAPVTLQPSILSQRFPHAAAETSPPRAACSRQLRVLSLSLSLSLSPPPQPLSLSSTLTDRRDTYSQFATTINWRHNAIYTLSTQIIPYVTFYIICESPSYIGHDFTQTLSFERTYMETPKWLESIYIHRRYYMIVVYIL
jgi:hypothetical protein